MILISNDFREEYPEGHPPVCCTEGQVDDLLKNFGAADAILGRCPTCYYNFRVNFCDMTCSPHQGKFLKPLKTVKGPYQPCGLNSGGRPDVQRKKLLIYHMHLISNHHWLLPKDKSPFENIFE